MFLGVTCTDLCIPFRASFLSAFYVIITPCLFPSCSRFEEWAKNDGFLNGDVDSTYVIGDDVASSVKEGSGTGPGWFNVQKKYKSTDDDKFPNSLQWVLNW